MKFDDLDKKMRLYETAHAVCVLLKRDVKDVWWNDMVMAHNELVVPGSATLQCAGK